MSQLHRRRLLTSIAKSSVGFAMGIAVSFGHAQTPSYPNRPIRFVLGAPAGGGGDALARLFSQHMAATLKVPIVIDNKPGASGNIGADMVAKSPADGYTVLFAYTGHSINPALYKALPFDPFKDFKPVAHLVSAQSVLLVRSSLPTANLHELVTLAKTKPDGLTFATLPGTVHFLAGKLLEQTAGVRFVVVPYKGTPPALNDLASGQVDLMFNTVLAAQPMLKTGKVRALAVTGKTRTRQLPSVETATEAGFPELAAEGWYGILVPAATPTPIVEALNRAALAALADPAVRERLASMDTMPIGGTPEAFDRFIRQEAKRWEGVIRKAGISAE
jgi:tripartite-type tricarboxylate transporter receptor subunit TctC